MPLIECPQDSCSQKISPTAQVCPSCGYDVVTYFIENLKGYENNPGMQNYVHWVDNRDGTITDTKQNLTWIRAPYGLSWNGKYFTGKPEKFKWIDATLRFGRGNVVEAFDENNRNFNVNLLIQNSKKENGYTIGKQTVRFAGRSDWRLPTISEYLYLRELRTIADGFLDERYIYIFRCPFLPRITALASPQRRRCFFVSNKKK